MSPRCARAGSAWWRWLVGLSAWMAVTAAALDLGAQTMQERRTARRLAGEALDLYEAGDYAAALDKFQRAHELVPAPTLGLRIARSLDRLDRMKEAAERYRRVIEAKLEPWDPPQHHQARKEAVPELAALLDKIPSVVVRVEGEGAGEAEVRIEGTALPAEMIGERQKMDPGHYVFEARVGDRRVREEVELDRGKTMRVVLQLPPLAPPPAPEPPPPPAPEPPDDFPWTIGGWSAIGVGGAAAIVGAVTGGLVLGRQGELEQRCPERRCEPEVHDDAREFNHLRRTTTAMLVLGGAGVAAGTTLLLLAPDRPAGDRAQLRPIVGFGMLGVAGGF